MATWTTYQLLLAAVMVITGSINTLSTKWADKQSAIGSDGQNRPFDHPFLQAWGMFFGEFMCLLAYLCIRIRAWCSGHHQEEPGEQSHKFNPLIFLPAAVLDMIGTSVMYIGLNLTYASSFQMLRGSVIIFTALLSVAFLGRVIKRHMWIGMFLLFLGLLLVGLADIVFGSPDNNTNMNGVIAGDLLIIIAQVVAAVQMVYEERFIGRFNVHPLVAVGLEGLWGAIVLGILLVPFNYIHAGSFSNTADHYLENVKDAFTQMGNNRIIIWATVGNIISIAFFNFAGISVTKDLSATTRMVLDSVRTLVIWIFSLAIKWQKFQYLQVIGFILLLTGMALYNDIIIMPVIRKYRDRRNGNVQADGTADERSRLITNSIKSMEDSVNEVN